MNPSYTNPVDGTNAGGTKPQVSGGSVPVQSAAQQVGTDDNSIPVQPAAQQTGTGGDPVVQSAAQTQQAGNVRSVGGSVDGAGATFASLVSPVTSVAPVGATPMPTSSFSQNIPLSSGTGDIILGGGTPEKKSRKGLIALIVAVVLLILVGGGILLWQSGAFGGGDKPSAELTTKLREVINYMYSGEESDAPLAEIPEDAEFKFVTEFNSDDYASRSEYFEKAMTLQDEAMGLLLDNGNDARSSYNALLTDAGLRLDRISLVAMTDALPVEDLEESYMGSVPIVELKKEIDERYGELVKNENEDVKFYGQAYVDFLNMRVDEFVLISQNNCSNYISDWGDLDGLEECPNLETFIEKLRVIENTQGKAELQGKADYNPSTEKRMADEMIKGDTNRLIEIYKQLNMELSK